MSMDGAYGSHCQQLMQQERYQKFIRDADSPKVLYQNMDAKQRTYLSQINMNKQYVVRSNGQYGYRNTMYTNTTNTNTVNQQSLQEAWNEARRKTIAAEPKLNACSANIVSSAAIKGICQRFQTEIDRLSQLFNDLEEVKEYVGQERLYVDNKNYEIRLDEIRDKIAKYRTTMQEFVDSATERADFVQDFQQAVEKDYYRYYGKFGPYNTKKDWDRTNKGWS